MLTKPSLSPLTEEKDRSKPIPLLPEEVLEEVVQHVAVPVELQETLRVLRFRGDSLGGAVGVQPGYHANFARLLVTDNQHALFSDPT